MHLKPISYDLRRELYNRDHPWRSDRKRSRSKKERKRRKNKKFNELDELDDENIWKQLEGLNEDSPKQDETRDQTDCDRYVNRVIESPLTAKIGNRSPSVPKSYNMSKRILDTPSSVDSFSSIYLISSNRYRSISFSSSDDDDELSNALGLRLDNPVTNNGSCR
jgi:hypothetical protein